MRWYAASQAHDRRERMEPDFVTGFRAPDPQISLTPHAVDNA